MAKSGTVRAAYRCAECGWQTTQWVGRCGECQAWGTIELGRRRRCRRPRARGRRPGVRARAAHPRRRGRGRAGPADRRRRARPRAGRRARPRAVSCCWRASRASASPPCCSRSRPGSPRRPARALRHGRGVGGPGAAPRRPHRRPRPASLPRRRDRPVGHARTRRRCAARRCSSSTPCRRSAPPTSTARRRRHPGPRGRRRADPASPRTARWPSCWSATSPRTASIAGPRLLEHLVDVVLHFEGERHSTLRMVRAMKNRFGPADEVGCFELADDGIRRARRPQRAVPLRVAHRPGAGHLRHRDAGGSATPGRRGAGARRARRGPRPGARPPGSTATGSRWCWRSSSGTPSCGSGASGRPGGTDVYASTVGGMRITEPAADLAIASPSRRPRRRLPCRQAWSRSARSAWPARSAASPAVRGGWPRRPGSASPTRSCRPTPAGPRRHAPDRGARRQGGGAIGPGDGRDRGGARADRLATRSSPPARRTREAAVMAGQLERDTPPPAAPDPRRRRARHVACATGSSASCAAAPAR